MASSTDAVAESVAAMSVGGGGGGKKGAGGLKEVREREREGVEW